MPIWCKLVRGAAIETAIVALVLTACGSGGSEPLSPTARSSAGDLVLNAAQLSSISGVSEFQANLLADGTLTFAEYESAVFAAVQCLRDKGFEITGYPTRTATPGPGPVLTRRGELQYLPKSRANLSGDSEAIAACENRYTSVIRPLWASHVAPSQDEMQRARDAIGACLVSNGTSGVSEHPSGEELLAIAFPPDGVPRQPPITSYQRCAESVAVEFDIPGYFGQ